MSQHTSALYVFVSISADAINKSDMEHAGLANLAPRQHLEQAGGRYSK